MERSRIQENLNQLISEAKTATRDIKQLELGGKATEGLGEVGKSVKATEEAKAKEAEAAAELAKTQTEENKEKIAQAEEIESAGTKADKQAIAVSPLTEEERAIVGQRNRELEQRYSFKKGIREALREGRINRQIIDNPEEFEKILQELPNVAKMTESQKKALTVFEGTQAALAKMDTKVRVQTRQAELTQGGDE